MRKCRQNPITQAGAAARDPVREGRNPLSRRKPRTAIRADAELEVLDIPEVEGVDMPKPHEFLSAEQRDGSTLQAEEIYTETWEWLKEGGLCGEGVSPAIGAVRHVQCPLDSVRGDDQPHGLPLQASDHPEADSVPVHQHRHQLHEPGGAALERNLPDREGKLQHGLRGGLSPG